MSKGEKSKMERRQVLKAGLFGGALFLGERLTVGATTQKKGTKPQFFSGTLSGQDFGGWKFRMGAAGIRGQGFARDPEAAPSDPSKALLMLGKVSRGKFKLAIFAIRDYDLQNQLGTASGKIKNGAASGNLTLNDGRKATFTISQVQKDAEKTEAVIGTWRGQVEDGAPGYQADVEFKTNGGFEVTNIVDPDGKPTGGRLAGVFVISEELDKGYAMLLPTRNRSGLDSAFGQSLVSCCCDNENELLPDNEKDSLELDFYYTGGDTGGVAKEGINLEAKRLN
jgi:hypothetical protein